MFPYYALVAAPVLVSIVQRMRHEKNQGKHNYYPIIVFFVIYFLILALRDKSVGSDTSGYLNIFSRLSRFSFDELLAYKETEYGYTFFNKFVSIFTDNSQIFIAVVAAIIVIPVMHLYYKESEDSLMSIALFLVLPVFIMNFSGFRQAIAIALGVPAFYATKDKKLFRFILIVLLAFSFHQSAFILALMYPMYHANIKRKHLLLLTPALLITFFNAGHIFSYLLPFFGEKYAESYSEITSTGAYTMIILFAMFIVYSFILPDENLVDDTTKGLRNFLVLTMFVQLFSSISTITMRMNYYYLIFLPLLIPKITNRWVNVDKRLVYVVRIFMTAFFIIYYLKKAHVVDSLKIYPYVPFWK